MRAQCPSNLRTNIHKSNYTVAASSHLLLPQKFSFSLKTLRKKQIERKKKREKSSVAKIRFNLDMTIVKVVCGGIAAEKDDDMDVPHQPSALILHPLSDLSHVSPVVFVSLLKQCYVYGKSKATVKFRALQQHVYLALCSNPQPGPATFVIHCLYVLPFFEPIYRDGFSHLILSVMRRTLKGTSTSRDCTDAKDLAARLFLEIAHGFVDHDDKSIRMRILEIFDVKLENIEKAMCRSGTEIGNLGTGKAFIEKYISDSIDAQSYMTAVSLMEQFSIRWTGETGESLMHKMLETNNFRAAEKWVNFMGKSMICLLVKGYVDLNMIKAAHGILKKNDLQDEFPDVHKMYKESSLKKLAEKGCWDVAEERTKNERQLLEYLVFLAMEAGYSEKVDELCDRYSLEGFVKSRESEVTPPQSRYLQLHEFSIDDVIWVDEVMGLKKATSYIEGCKVVGIDCEWKPNHIKGSKPNKVSIMQLATEKRAYIFDLIKLYDDNLEMLDSCLSRILQSGILKLGYNFGCDIHQLASSYNEMQCFKHYDMLLDIQNVFKEPCGGLSGLAKNIFGVGLNKMRRNSNWEQRPLTKSQLEYAALDAVVLIHLFWYMRNHPQPVEDGDAKMEWKSKIISRMDHAKKSKKKDLGAKTKKLPC